MDKLKAVQDHCKTAQADLKALQDELPQFHALLSENETAAETLRADRAPLDKQAEARGRVQVVREMLEQHHADIATAQAEVNRLEANLAREQRLDRLTAHALKANEHRSTVENAVADAARDLQHAVQTIVREWSAFDAARTDFVAVGADEMGTMQWLGEPIATGFQGEARERLRGQVAGILETLQERGADLSGLLEGGTVAIEHRLKVGERPLPAEGLAMLVWLAVLAYPDVPHSLKLTAPKPRQPVSVRYIDPLPDPKYSL